MRKRTYTGINIQFPISRLILEGKKTVETRTYPIPKSYIGQELAIIETPGKTRNFNARIIGTVRFSECFEYENEKQFYLDKKRHCVTPDSPWKWTKGKTKWGWPVQVLRQFPLPIPFQGKRGIVYAKAVEIPSSYLL